MSLQARFRGNARRARLMKSRLSSAHAAGGAFAIFGILDAVVFESGNIVKKKMGIGKQF